MRQSEKSSSSTRKQNGRKGNGNTEILKNQKFYFSREDKLRNTLWPPSMTRYYKYPHSAEDPSSLCYLPWLFSPQWILNSFKTNRPGQTIYLLSNCFVYALCLPKQIVKSDPVTHSSFPSQYQRWDWKRCKSRGPRYDQIRCLIPFSFSFLTCKWLGWSRWFLREFWIFSISVLLWTRGNFHSLEA